MKLKFLHFHHPHSIPIFKLSIIYLQSLLFTIAGFLTNILKIFLIRIIFRDVIPLLTLRLAIVSVYTVNKIDLFQTNLTFLYPLEVSEKLRFSVLVWNWLKRLLFSQGQKFIRLLSNEAQAETHYIFSYLFFHVLHH